jgi:transposase
MSSFGNQTGAGTRRFRATITPPHADESLLGFVTRALSLTAAPHLKSALKLAGIQKLAPVAIATTLTDAREIAGLATLLNTTPDEIRKRTYAIGTFDHSTTETLDFFGVRIRAQYRENVVRRLSPRALEISRHHRAPWELRPFSFDFATKESLLDTCPACKQKLGWRRSQGPTKCDKCVDRRGLPNVDLRDFPQPLVEIEDIEALDFVTGLVDPNPARKKTSRKLLPARWADFSNDVLFETVMALASGLTMDPAVSTHAQGRAKRNEHFARLTPEMLALAGRAIIGRDEGFAALADRYRADMDKRPRLYGRRKELGPLAYITHDRHLSPDIRDELEKVVDTNMKFTCRDYPLRTGKDADQALLSIDALGKMFKIRRSIMGRMSKSGRVPVVRAEDGRSPVRMAVADIKPLIPLLKDAIGENEAAGLLGLPVHVLSGLADRKLIDRLEGAVQGFVPGNAGYTQSSVNRLLESLWRRSAAKVPPSPVPLVIAARSIRSGEAPWGAIIAAILAGQVEVFSDPAKRKNIRYSLVVADVGKFATGVRRHLRASDDGSHPEWIGKATAAEMLKVTEVFVWRLAKVRPDLLNSHENGYTPFKSAAVTELARKYIFVPEVMDRANMKARRACGWLKSQGVKPAFSLQDNKDFAFLRNVVEPLILQQTTAEAKHAVALPERTDSIRTRLVKAVANGAETKATAKKLGVGYREAVRWVIKWKSTGLLEPEKFGKKSPLDQQVEFMRELLAKTPEISLLEIQAALDQRGIKRSQSAVWNCLERHGIELGGRRKRQVAA